MVGFNQDQIVNHLPYYLTAPEKEGLLQALKDFPRRIDYYISRYDDELLQGDAWTSVPVVDYNTGAKKLVKAIVLSNTCSVAPENNRLIPAKVVVSPLISLDKYCELLKACGADEGSVEQKVAAIKEQRVGNIFYLPKGGGLDFEAIAILDDLHSLPASILSDRDAAAKKLTTLATVGFYLFLFKLSIHFCRFHENLPRSDIKNIAVP